MRHTYSYPCLLLIIKFTLLDHSSSIVSFIYSFCKYFFFQHFFAWPLWQWGSQCYESVQAIKPQLLGQTGRSKELLNKSIFLDIETVKPHIVKLIKLYMDEILNGKPRINFWFGLKVPGFKSLFIHAIHWMTWACHSQSKLQHRVAVSIKWVESHIHCSEFLEQRAENKHQVKYDFTFFNKLDSAMWVTHSNEHEESMVLYFSLIYLYNCINMCIIVKVLQLHIIILHVPSTKVQSFLFYIASYTLTLCIMCSYDGISQK